MKWLELKVCSKKTLECFWKLQAQNWVFPFFTTNIVLRESLKVFKYKMSFLQPLFPGDYPLQLDYAKSTPRVFRRDYEHLEIVSFSQEWIFRINGVVIEHNTSACDQESPSSVKQVPERPEMVIVRCEMRKRKVLGPYFISKPSVKG